MNVLNKKGVVLIIGLAFLVLFVTIAVWSIATITSEFNIIKRSTHSLEAFYLAESGIHKALYELRKDYGSTGWTGCFVIDWYGLSKGEYEVGVSDVAGNKRVVSTGYFPHKAGYYVKRSVEVDIAPPTPGWFFGNAIVAGENVDLNGSYTVNGNILYGESINPAGLGQKFDSLFPMLDFEQLKGIAVAQGNLYTQARIDSNDPFPSDFWYDETNNVPNVVYIETNLVLKGNVGTLCGFFVVAGDVITNPDPEDVEADTTINGNGTIDGCVYTLGDFRINGGGNGLGVTGGVWGRDEVRLNGNAQVSYNQGYMNAISGLNIGFKPQIIMWREKY